MGSKIDLILRVLWNNEDVDVNNNNNKTCILKQNEIRYLCTLFQSPLIRFILWTIIYNNKIKITIKL